MKICIPPPWPSVSLRGTEWDGPLILNALLVLAERHSALKRAQFGSETSAAALQGMRVLLCHGAQGVPMGIEKLVASQAKGEGIAATRIYNVDIDICGHWGIIKQHFVSYSFYSIGHVVTN